MDELAQRELLLQNACAVLEQLVNDLAAPTGTGTMQYLMSAGNRQLL